MVIDPSTMLLLRPFGFANMRAEFCGWVVLHNFVYRFVLMFDWFD